MELYRRYSVILGLFLLALVVILLVSAPSSFFSKGVSFIDSEMNKSSGDETYVQTKMDLGDNEHMKAFPQEIGEWRGYDYGTTAITERLQADLVLLRGYIAPGLYQPIFFTIVQSKTKTSFHSPTVCYRSQGYTVDEEGRDQVTVSDASWATDPDTLANSPITVGRLVVHKEADGKVTERRVALYYYVKGNRFASNTITMIEISALAPINSSYDGILGEMKDLTAETVPYIFEPASSDTKDQRVVMRLAGWGVTGYLVIALLLSLPVGIALYPIVARPGGPSQESASHKIRPTDQDDGP